VVLATTDTETAVVLATTDTETAVVLATTIAGKVLGLVKQIVDMDQAIKASEHPLTGPEIIPDLPGEHLPVVPSLSTNQAIGRCNPGLGIQDHPRQTMSMGRENHTPNISLHWGYIE
jgi:hypothetical protein